MKKILVADNLKSQCLQNNSFLSRQGMTVFSAATNDEILKIHSVEKVDLIVSKIDLPGLTSEELFENIRHLRDLRGVATILICDDTSIHHARCKQCGANAVLTLPVDISQLHAKMQQLLDIAPRQAYRVTLKVSVEGKFKNKPFLYRTDNISATGMLITAEVRAEERLAKGDILSFSFYLPDGTQIIAQGTVERVIPQTIAANVCLYGIKFMDLTPNVKSAIETFVRKERNYKLALDVHTEAAPSK
jgi:DNA-binding response OmpR family regulator